MWRRWSRRRQPHHECHQSRGHSNRGRNCGFPHVYSFTVNVVPPGQRFCDGFRPLPRCRTAPGHRAEVEFRKVVADLGGDPSHTLLVRAATPLDHVATPVPVKPCDHRYPGMAGQHTGQNPTAPSPATHPGSPRLGRSTAGSPSSRPGTGAFIRHAKQGRPPGPSTSSASPGLNSCPQ